MQEILSDLIPHLQELKDREQFSSADMSPQSPVTVRPGTTEVPRLQEEEEDE